MHFTYPTIYCTYNYLILHNLHIITYSKHGHLFQSSSSVHSKNHPLSPFNSPPPKKKEGGGECKQYITIKKKVPGGPINGYLPDSTSQTPFAPITSNLGFPKNKITKNYL